MEEILAGTGTVFFRENIETIWRRYGGDAYYIAKLYQISSSSVYRILRQYCKDNNKNYQAYLRYPHKNHVMRNGKVVRVKSVKKRAEGEKHSTFKIKKKTTNRIPQAFIVDEELEYISELLRSSCHTDVIEGADLMLVFIEDLILRDGRE